MKKSLSILSILVLSLFVLTGCGGSDPAPEANQSEPAEAAETTGEAAFASESYENISYEVPGNFSKAEDSSTDYEARGMKMHSIEYSHPYDSYSITVTFTTFTDYAELTAAQYADQALDMFAANLTDREERTLSDGTPVIVGRVDSGSALTSDNSYFKPSEDAVVTIEFKGYPDITDMDEMDASFEHLLSTLTIGNP